MKTKLKQTKGITLIALIITIIILLILAMVTIRILMNQGIIKHAENATAAYNDAQNNETEYLTYAEGEMDKYAGGSSASAGGAWTDNGDGTFTRGSITLKVGDYIAYDHTKDANGNAVAVQSYTSYSSGNASVEKNNGRTNGSNSNYSFDVNNYTSGWTVMGVHNGNLQLIANGSVGVLYLGSQNGYCCAEEELNAIGAIYGQGAGAMEARSINIDDINKATGYNPAVTGDGTPYKNGKIDQYGNDVTYYWKGDGSPYYVGANAETGTLDSRHSGGFRWYDNSGLNVSPKSTTATNTEQGRERITTLKSTYYIYYPYSLTTSGDTTGEKKGISTDSNEYKTLFGQYYWIASRFVCCGSGYASFGVYYMYGNRISSHLFFTSYGSSNSADGRSVRPVVTLSPDAQIKTDGTQDGSTQAKAYTIE